MAKVKYLGDGDEGPDEVEWFGHTLKTGEFVDIGNNTAMIENARDNRFFEVDETPSPRGPAPEPPKAPPSKEDLPKVSQAHQGDPHGPASMKPSDKTGGKTVV